MLARQLHDVALGIPGVVTLVPTMSSALSRLRPRPAADRPDRDRSPDGVSVSVEDGAVAAVIDITVAPSASVLTTAQAVHAAAVSALGVRFEALVVRVNVLGLEAAPDER
jgi:hypothetical protein